MLDTMNNSRDARIAFYLKNLAEGPLPSAVLHERLSQHLIHQRIAPVELRTVQEDLAILQRQLGKQVLVRVTRRQLSDPIPAVLAQHRFFYHLVDAAAIFHLPEPLKYLPEIEVIALEAARDFFAAGEGKGNNPLAMAIGNLVNRLSLPSIDEPQTIGVAFAPRQPFSADHLRTIVRARRLGEGLRIDYTPLEKPTKTYHVFPILLWFSDGEPYCWVWDIAASCLKNFKLCRASAVEAVDLPGSPPIGIAHEAKRFCNESFRGIANDDQRAHVVIRFRGGATPFIRDRTYGKNQQVQDLDSGEIRLSFHTAGLGGIYHWVLQFGADAVVEEPPRLAQWVRGEAERMMKRYHDAESNPVI